MLLGSSPCSTHHVGEVSADFRDSTFPGFSSFWAKGNTGARTGPSDFESMGKEGTAHRELILQPPNHQIAELKHHGTNWI